MLRGFLNAMARIFDRIIALEAQRVIHLYDRVYESQTDKEEVVCPSHRRTGENFKTIRGRKRTMRKLIAVMVLMGFMVVGAGGRPACATEIDILLQKLVDKGVLTSGEAQQIGTETKEQVKAETAAGKNASLPAWVQNIKLKGDFRLRYQYKHEASTTYPKDTHIGRVRVRLGMESKVNDKILAGIGIATNSGGDPRSTNITFGDKNGGYSTKMEMRLDYAYGKYTPTPWMTLTGGKMLLADVLWEPTDLVWDTDITPEGAIVALNKSLNANATVFVNAGVIVGTSDTSGTADTVNMYLVQPGLNYKFSEKASLKGVFSLYDWSNVKGTAYPTDSWYKSSNTKTGTTWTYDYRVASPALEFSLAEPFKAVGLNVEKLKIFGEYVDNMAVSKKNTGYAMGFQFGHDKVEKWGNWQLRYLYAMLEKDAVLDVTPDSDRYSGKTGMRSHEFSLIYGLGKNTNMAVDIYRSWNIDSSVGGKAPETLVQVDWNLKF